jgi:hypothetical protein
MILTELLMLFQAASATQSAPGAADLVVRQANIYTAATPAKASAMAVQGGRIVAIGGETAVAPWIGDRTVVLDAAGRTVVPGLIDSHAHLPGLGDALVGVKLVGTTSYAQVVGAVVERASTTPAGQWIMGAGWDQNDWPAQGFPHHRELSAAVPDHPVYLERIDGHAALVNARALALAGIDEKTADPPGGRIERDPSGRPTGVLVDHATSLVLAKIPPLDAEERQRRLLLAMRECARYGLTMVHDAGIGAADLAALRALLERGRFPIRVYVMASVAAGLAEEVLARGPEPGDRLMVRALKIVADGAMGSRGALMSEPYSDDPGNRGLETTPYQRIVELCRRALEAGIQVRTHAIGDLANTRTLDAYQMVFGGRPRPELRWAVEHCQVVRPADIRRFAELGVIASMETTHATSDGPWAESRLGPERVRWSYAWRQFLDAGVQLVNGSDFPVEQVNPMLGFYAALTRRDPAGLLPAGGWRPEEKLTPDETLKSFTIAGAYTAFREADLGSLEPGKQADFVVLDRDVLAGAPEAILGAKVLRTVVAGETVYRAD